MRSPALLRALSTLTLLLVFSFTGLSQTPRADLPALNKQIEELEERLKKLRDQLKNVKESKEAAPPQEAGPKMPAYLDSILTWRPIGPANMGGRIAALAVFETDPSCYYVATASGGLLKTENNGSTFSHQFDHESTVSLGAVAVAPSNRSIVWAGTGEANPRNSVSFGDGVYKSTDGGKTWQNKGLKKSYQIGKIVIHPTNPDIVYAGVLGRLYGPSEERGLFKTSDGGKSWQRIWFHDDKTGVIDIAINPSNPETLLLAAYERQRDEFDSFVGDAKAPEGTDIYAPANSHGPGSGIYRSTDGGANWSKIRTGLPNAKLGRIGLDWQRNNPNLVFAIVDSERAGTGLPPSKGFLGLTLENTPQGIQIASVQKESPAAKAKLTKGDRIVGLDDKDVKKTDDFLVLMQPRKPNEGIKLRYERGGKKSTADITLANQPAAEAKGKKQGGSLGVQIEETEDGVILTEVLEEGTAFKGGLKAGDVIMTVEGAEIGTMPLLFKTLANKKIGDQLKIVYQRGTEKKEATLILEAAPTPKGRPFAGPLGGQRANAQDMQGPGSNDTGGIYKSTDAGLSWTRINSLDERPFYFSVVRADPNDEKTIYALGVSLYRSTDGGKTFSPEGINTGVHSDQHDLWINPKDSRHLLLATDGGLYVSYDKAAHWEFLNYLALGQFYHVAVDARRPYHVYGGLQDNGSWGGPSQTLRPSGPSNADYQFVQGGDGFVCRVDLDDPDVVYSESQNGNMFRRNLRTGEAKLLRPKTTPGASKFRFNWNTPFILSQHNSHIFYAAGNYVFRSVKQGEDMKIISPEITRTKHGTGSALCDSPKNPDVLWAGSDDGALWLTRDGGKNWTELSDKLKAAGLPGPRWVASIEASRAAAGRCYVVFDGHRSNDDEPYVFVTEDYGQSWKSLRANLPVGPTRVLREDITNPDLLYLGTEFTLYASLQRGASWFKLNGAMLPTVAIHEIAQPTTAAEIVAATHGRSLWVLDVSTLRQLKTESEKTILFSPSPVIRWQLDFTHEGMFKTGTRQFVGQNPPRQAILDYLLPKKAAELSLKVLDPQGKMLQELDVAKEKDAGLHRITWNLTTGPATKGKKGGQGKQGKGGAGFGGELLKPGTYVVALEADGSVDRRLITIEVDPRTKTAGSMENEGERLRKWLKQP